MVSETRRIRSAHSAGKWLLTDTPAFQRNVRRLRQTHTIVTRTEATDRSFNGVLNWPDDGWGQFHPTTGLGHDCSVEWDKSEWAIMQNGVTALTDIRVTTQGGVLLQPCALTWVVLINKHNGGEVEVGAAHLDLSNTQLRRQANLESCHTMRRRYQAQKTRHPNRRFLYQFDGNRDQRKVMQRRYIQNNLLKGTDLHSGWSAPFPKGGTRGKALLDMAATDLEGETRLLPDDASSDHRPIEGAWLLPGAA